MAKNQTLHEFYKQFREEVLCATDTETSGWTTDDFLTAVMLEYLEEVGEVTDPIICPYRDRGLQMNAYAISEDCESVDLFVSIYSDTEMPRSVSQTDIEVAIKRGVQLYQRAINDLYASFEKDNDKVDGPPVQYITWSTMEGQCKKLKALLKQLAEQHINPEQITILSPRKREDSVVAHLDGYTVKDFKVPAGLNTTFCTIQAYKGLENTVIILTDIESFNSDKLMYVGLSRACSGLFVLENDAAKKEYDDLLLRRLLNER